MVSLHLEFTFSFPPWHVLVTLLQILLEHSWSRPHLEFAFSFPP